MNVKGDFVGDGQDGFIYRYTCRCGKAFKSSSPDLSAPALCHGCVTGYRKGNKSHQHARGSRVVKKPDYDKKQYE